MKQVRVEIRRLFRLAFDRDGVTALEYGLLTGLIALVIVGAVTLFGGNASSLFTHLANTI
ncbi:MAG TPA: Flp family type IVb pilin [Stellaceae bacterium]|jgi:pilus assembly protein Flp/PilA